MMKVLFVVLFPIKGNTSGVISNIGLINGLMKQGCEVNIVTVKEYGDNLINETNLFTSENYSITYRESGDLYKNVVDRRTKSSATSASAKIMSVLRKVYYKCKILDNMTSVARKIDIEVIPQQEYDIVISASDPKSSHVAVSRLIKQGLKYKKWVEYWGDPLALDITNRNIYPLFIRKFVETNILRNADKICYVSPLTYEKQKKHYPRFAEKMFFLPLPYDKKRIMGLAGEKTENIKLGYFGDYNSRIRNIMPLYHSCRKFGFSLTIAGSSDLQLECCENVEVLPRISKEKIERLEEDSDILVCLLNKNGTQIPGKIYYAAATNKPILMILDGENRHVIKRFFEKYDRYVICDNTEADIKRAVEFIRNHEREYQPLEEFSPEKVAEKLIYELGL